MSLNTALEEWASLLGPERVSRSVSEKHKANTIGLNRAIPAVLSVSKAETIPEVVKIAAKHNVPLYPVSSGQNWGYGSALPVRDGSVILDLSLMKQIVEFDSDLGLITIEPGVTQGELCEFLEREGNQFITPITGSHPTCSVLANALERGFGLTPYFDHFASVNWIEAVLASGEWYRSAPSGNGFKVLSRCHRDGIGPYIDGLFAQSSFGITTKMTIQLARRSPDIRLFIFSTKDSSSAAQLMPVLRNAFYFLDGRSVAIKIATRAYMNAIDGTSDSEHSALSWSIWGAIYGESAIGRQKIKLLRKVVKPFCDYFYAVSDRNLEARLKLLRALPVLLQKLLVGKSHGFLNHSASLLELVRGKPGQYALRLPYFGNPDTPGDLNPARDGKGLIWYPAVIPFTQKDFESFSGLIEGVCREFGLPPVVTISVASPTSLICIFAIIFKKATDSEKGMSVYRELLHRGAKLGFLPYRGNIDCMSDLMNYCGVESQAVAKKIKNALDPHGVISPGRYSA